jgi:hypothetical protein
MSQYRKGAILPRFNYQSLRYMQISDPDFGVLMPIDVHFE